MHTYILLHYISLEYLYSYPPNNLSHLAQPRPKSLPYSYSYYLSPSLVYPATFNFNKSYLYPTTPYYFLLTKQTYLPILSISTLPCYLLTQPKGLPPCLSYIHTFIHPILHYYYYYQPYLLHACIHTYMHTYQVTPCLTCHLTYYQHNPPIGTPRVLLLASTLLYM
jgi:hypothetical protein